MHARRRSCADVHGHAACGSSGVRTALVLLVTAIASGCVGSAAAPRYVEVVLDPGGGEIVVVMDRADDVVCASPCRRSEPLGARLALALRLSRDGGSPYEAFELPVDRSGAWQLVRRDRSGERIYGGVVLGVGAALSALAIGSGTDLWSQQSGTGTVSGGALLILAGGVTALGTLIGAGYLLGLRDHLVVVPVVDAGVDGAPSTVGLSMAGAW
jgi:hypothetical protein